MINAIVATDKNNGIGFKGDLLFLIPEDMSRFITLTNGKRVIMGRKTFDSLNKRPLPNRVNMIITNDNKKITESASKVLNAITNFNSQEKKSITDDINDNDTYLNTLFDENNAIELWYNMNAIKNLLQSDKLTPSNEDIFVIGGSEIYKELLPYCDRIYLTKYNKECKADRYFPTLDAREWDIIDESDIKEHEGETYQFITYQRIQEEVGADNV